MPAPAYRYERVESETDGKNFRVTHVRTDSRVATCYDLHNALLVVEALNALDPKGKRYP